MKFQFFFIVFNLIIIHTEITGIQKIKARACIKLYSKKYKEEEKKITNFLQHLSNETKITPKQLIQISLSICYKIIPDELARAIHNLGNDFRINQNNSLLSKLYNFENYNYNNIELIESAYKEFMPVLTLVNDELRMQNKTMGEIPNFRIEFIHTPLFKVFFYYFIINTLIIFYKRIKYPPKTINKDDSDDSKKD